MGKSKDSFEGRVNGSLGTLRSKCLVIFGHTFCQDLTSPLIVLKASFVAIWAKAAIRRSLTSSLVDVKLSDSV